jgi:hypothetical protein
MPNPFKPQPSPWEPEQDTSLGHQIEDLAFAPARGAVGFAQGVYGLADALTGDSLPDWRDNPLGRSDTLLGGLAEGATQFMLGFVPVAGWGKWAGLLGKAGWAAESGFTAASVARSLTAGAITDFAVWQGHQDRLSNLIQSNPSLANPISEFLAADPNDPELLGRLKGAVEGAGFGVLADATMAGIRKLAVYSRTRGEILSKIKGEPTQEVLDAAHVEAATKAEAEIPEAEIRRMTDEAQAIESPFADVKPPAVKPAAESLALPGEPAKAVPEAEPPPTTIARKTLPPLTARTTLGHSLAASMADVEKYGAMSREDLQKVISTVDEIITHNAEVKAVTGGPAPLEVNPRNLTGPQLLEYGLKKNALDISKFDISDGGKALIRTYDYLFQAADKGWKAEAVTEQTFARQAADSLNWISDFTGAKSPDAMFAAVAHKSETLGLDVQQLSARVLGLKTMLSTVAEGSKQQIDHFSAVLAGKVPGDAKLEALIAWQNIQKTAQLSATLNGVKAEVGRALGGMRQKSKAIDSLLINFRDFADKPEKLEAFMKQAGGEKNMSALLDKMRVLYGDGSSEGMASFGRAATAMNQSLMRRGFDAFMDVWYGFMLSGPKTVAVNAGGPLAYSYFKPMEALVGTAAMKLAGNPAQKMAATGVARELYAQMRWMTTGAQEAVATARRLGLDSPDVFGSGVGSSVLDTVARRKSLTPENFPELDQNGIAAAAIAWLGKAVRIPTGVLGTTDNAIKTLVYRGAAAGKIEAELLGKPGMTAELARKQTIETMDRLIWDHQVWSHDMLLRRGLAEADKQGIKTASERALYATEYVNTQIKLHPEDQALSEFAKAQGYDSTLTTPAEQGSLSRSVQNFQAQQPVFRLVAPFVNTPINIMKAAGQRLDVLSVARYFAGQLTDPKYMALQNSKMRFIKEMMSNDPRLQAEAIGRISTGMAVATTAYTLVNNGDITGGGPSDYAQKKTLLDAGWQPYSVRVGDGYVAYTRLDPLASLLGTIADIYEYSQYAPEGPGNASADLSLAVATSIANNLTNKTYVTGIANFLDAARQPGKYMPNLMRSYASSMVPNILGQSVNTVGGDDTLRDVNTMLDAAKNKIPGLSSTLPPARNVLGEPMSRNMSLGGRVTDWWLPVGYREISDDKVKLALAQTGHGFSPPRSDYEGLDLNNVPVGSTTAYDRWGELQGTVRIGGMSIKDAMRKLIASEVYQRSIPTAIGETESPRVNMLNSIIYRYRDAAWRQLLKESPELDTHYRNVITNKLSARRGDLLSIGR